MKYRMGRKMKGNTAKFLDEPSSTLQTCFRSFWRSSNYKKLKQELTSLSLLFIYKVWIWCAHAWIINLAAGRDWFCWQCLNLKINVYTLWFSKCFFMTISEFLKIFLLTTCKTRKWSGDIFSGLQEKKVKSRLTVSLLFLLMEKAMSNSTKKQLKTMGYIL